MTGMLAPVMQAHTDHMLWVYIFPSSLASPDRLQGRRKAVVLRTRLPARP